MDPSGGRPTRAGQAGKGAMMAPLVDFHYISDLNEEVTSVPAERSQHEQWEVDAEEILDA
jgi:hypothetical protein